MYIEEQTCDVCGHGVPLKVNPNVRIPPFKYLAEEVMQRSYWEDITTATYNGTTVRHVITVEEVRTVCHQQEADADRTSHHTCSELRILERSGQYI